MYPCDINKHFIIQEIKESKDWIGSYSAGCLISNSNDLIVFLTNLLRGKIINNYYVSLMKEPSFQSLYTKNHKPDNVVGYGMGLMLYNLYEYGYGYGHTGIIPGFKAMVFYSQTYNTFFSICANFFNSYSMTNLLKNILYNYSRNTINNSLLRTNLFNKKYIIPSMYISIYKNNNSCIITRNIVLLCLITILYISYKYCTKK